MEDFSKKKSQILENHKKAIEMIQSLTEKKNKLADEIDMLTVEQDKVVREISKVNNEIEKKQLKIDQEVNNPDTNKSGLDLGVLTEKCKEVFAKFVENPGPNSNATLTFYITYGHASIIRQIEDDRMSFAMLKLETKSQFDKEANEFFFADENDVIYMDKLNVKRALFPINSVNIKNYIPTIKVVDRKSRLEKYLKEGNQLKAKMDEEQKKVDSSAVMDRVLSHLNKKKFYYPHFLFYILFFIFWTVSSLDFRKITYLNSFVRPFSMQFGYLFKNATTISRILPDIEGNIVKLFKFPSRNSSRNTFNEDYDCNLLFI